MIKFVVFILSFINLFAYQNSYYKGVLDNNLTFYHQKPFNYSDFLFIEMKLNFGSINENDSQLGLAHFLEHLSFNSTLSNSRDEILSTLQNKGVKIGLNLNAFTDFESTNFKIQILNSDDNLDTALKFFSSILYNLAFKEDEIQKEKNIILNEAIQRDDKEYGIFKSRLKLYYGDSLYTKRLPIGDLEVIKKANKKVLKELYFRHYNPCNTTLFILGDMDTKRLKASIDKHFAKLDNKFKCNDRKEEIKFIDKNITFINPLIDEMAFYFETKKLPKINEDGFLNDIKFNLLSKILLEINYKNSLKNEIKFSSINILNQKNLNKFYIKSLKYDDLFELISVLKMLKNGIDESYFNSAKKELLREVFLYYSKYPSPLNQLNDMIKNINENSFVLGFKDEFNLNLKLINNLNLKEFNEFLNQLINFDKFIFESFIEINDLGSILKNTKEFLLKQNNQIKPTFKTLKPNKNVKYQYDKNLEIFIIDADGKKIIFKPAKSQKVYISAVKKGGLAASKNASFLKAAFEISNLSGTEKYSKKELDEFFKNDLLINKSIGNLSSSYNITTTISNLDYAFMILHNDFLYPKISNEVFNDFVANLNEEKSPKTKFEMKLNEIYYNEKELNLDFDIENLKQILKDEFSQNFTFFITGDIKFAHLLELIEKNISNLPNDKENLNFVDDGVRAILGNHIFIDKSNPFKKDEVYIFLNSNSYDFNPKNSEIFDSSVSILQTLINQNIREKDAQTYGVNFNASFVKHPYIHSFGQITFTTLNNNAKSISKKIKNIIDYYSKNLIDDEYLINYKKTAILKFQNLYKNPEFVLNLLINHFIYDEKFLTLDEKIKMINEISTSDIMIAISENFNNQNYFVAIFTHII
ncbi:hypothetical protein F1B92_06355 [Campylobacter sp. FMV-PI01]|uniref:Insulinase family protein n=1 Tax=Campylobacter portucalensis TaxID=2608384 RepID=A0A6L5WLA5_9BACT|nr:insulinase family protein [Campylobacter portucalensis]MSN96785.1 hypothetical protein [Campylobacter portucalensis]